MEKDFRRIESYQLSGPGEETVMSSQVQMKKIAKIVQEKNLQNKTKNQPQPKKNPQNQTPQQIPAKD